MIISFEAYANVDNGSFGYFSMKYDPEFFNDIKENILEISKDEPLTFSLCIDDVKLLYGLYHSIRKLISISDVEKQKFTDVLKVDFGNITLKKLKDVKLVIDKDYFYFVGNYSTPKLNQTIEFQSLNFDARFIDSLEKKYNKTMVE